MGKEFFKNISLGMYYGVKIGVFGFNGVGKLMLMKIFVGVDKIFDGDLYLEFGIKVGYFL